MQFASLVMLGSKLTFAATNAKVRFGPKADASFPRKPSSELRIARNTRLRRASQNLSTQGRTVISFDHALRSWSMRCL